jgi:AcrR family transcriptional regulator
VATKADARPLRADARRNQDRILDAAQEAFSEAGPYLPLDAIAARAGVSPATLFRHFANRDELVAAVVERRFADEVEPVVAEALAGDDAWSGLVAVFAATLNVGTNRPAWRETVLLAKESGLVGVMTERFSRPVGRLLERAQADGVVRPDVGPDDLRPIVRMLRGVMTAEVDVPRDAWLRYLSLLLLTPAPATGTSTGTSAKRSVEK